MMHFPPKPLQVHQKRIRRKEGSEKETKSGTKRRRKDGQKEQKKKDERERKRWLRCIGFGPPSSSFCLPLCHCLWQKEERGREGEKKRDSMKEP